MTTSSIRAIALGDGRPEAGRAMRRLGFTMLIMASLAGCASGAPELGEQPTTGVTPGIEYLPPNGSPPAARTAVVEQPPFLVFGNLTDRLQQSDFTVTHLDEQAGIVVAQYSGDAEPYVDCGYIVSRRAGELESTPAAKAAISFPYSVGGDLLELDRRLRLDGRMVVTLEPQGQGAVINARTSYVLTKTIEALQQDGRSRGRIREIVDFETGESATFSKGTLCQATGQFERVLLDTLPVTTSRARHLPRPALAWAG